MSMFIIANVEGVLIVVGIVGRWKLNMISKH